MADVSAKAVTRRTALACGYLRMGQEAFERLSEGTLGKGDAMVAAKYAGIMAAKKTSDWIPLCHPLALDNVQIEIVCDAASRLARVDATVTATTKTGVEMEALAAVSAALLTLYDMCKPYGQDMALEDIHLLSKTGGKSGDYQSRRDHDIR